MDVEVALALVSTVGAAVAVVIKRVNIMTWWQGRKEARIRQEARDADAFGWTRSQLEFERTKREEDAAAHRAEQERLRVKLEDRIANLEAEIAIRDADLYEAQLHAVRLSSDVARLQTERDLLQQELTNTREMYTKILSETFRKEKE